MKIEHIAIWVKDLEKARHFYSSYFNFQSNSKYTNAKKQFSSYFLSHSNGARIELMHQPELEDIPQTNNKIGLAHIAFSLGGKAKVDELTKQLEMDGYRIQGHPRTTGDGYYESIVLDPDGNWIEICE